MSPPSRKQLEIQQREALILDLARARLARDGYHKLRIEDIAEELRCAKGTIFTHFPSKEDIILAVAIQSMQQRVDFFRRASMFSGRPRERLLGVGYACELFYRLYPEHFALEHLIRSPSFWEKTTEQRRRDFRGAETLCVGTVGGIVMDGVARGDLSLPEGTSPTHLVFGLWSMTYGAYSILATGRDALSAIGIHEPYATLRENQNRLLDGHGWRPLSHEHNYDAVLQRIQTEVFADEYQSIRNR